MMREHCIALHPLDLPGSDAAVFAFQGEDAVPPVAGDVVATLHLQFAVATQRLDLAPRGFMLQPLLGLYRVGRHGAGHGRSRARVGRTGAVRGRVLPVLEFNFLQLSSFPSAAREEPEENCRDLPHQ